MGNFIASVSELNELKPIFAKYNFADIVKKIEQVNHRTDKAGNKILQYDIDRLYILDSKHVLNNTELLIALYEYTKDKSFNILKYLEDKLIKGHAWGSEFDGYVRLIKNTDYYLENSDNIYNLAKKQPVSTIKDFWNIVSLASCIQDNTISVKAFDLILRDKKKEMYSFTLLDLEKIKRLFDKRFKNVDVKTLPQSEYEFILNSFEEINISKSKSFCVTTSGSYLDVFVDVNLICQENKLSKGKNNTMLKGVFDGLISYVENAKDKPLSLTRVIIRDEVYTTMSFHLVFYYDDASQQDLIKSVVGDLIDYSIVKSKDGKLQGESIKQQDVDKFFSSFILNHTFEKTLGKKEDTKVKKNKL